VCRSVKKIGNCWLERLTAQDVPYFLQQLTRRWSNDAVSYFAAVANRTRLRAAINFISNASPLRQSDGTCSLTSQMAESVRATANAEITVKWSTSRPPAEDENIVQSCSPSRHVRCAVATSNRWSVYGACGEVDDVKTLVSNRPDKTFSLE